MTSSDKTIACTSRIALASNSIDSEIHNINELASLK